MTIYAIGDIHGQISMLEDVLARIEKDGGSNARIVFLGDYVDRGPDARGVIELISTGVAEGRNWVALRGNHDRMCARFLLPEPKVETRLLLGMDWLHEKLGGVETLASYGVKVHEKRRYFEFHAEAREAVPDHHQRFLNGLTNSHLEEGKLFVHAGVLPGVPLEQQVEDDLVWIREPFLSDRRPYPWLVVHGHTPMKRATLYSNRAALDTGAGFGYPLSVGVFEGEEVCLLGADGREAIHRSD